MSKLILLRYVLMIFLIFIIFSHAKVNAQPVVEHNADLAQTLSLDFQQVSLREVLRILAKWMQRNIVLSSTVNGYVTLHLQNASPEQVFEFLLKAHHLQAWHMANIWYVSTQDVLLKQKQEEAKWREIEEDSTPLIMRVWQIRYARAENIVRLLHNNNYSILSKRGHAHMDTRTNLVYVQDTPERIIPITNLIKRLDVPLKQVLIEARLASVDSDYEQELGVRFPVVHSDFIEARRGQFSLAVALLADGNLLDIKLAALEKEGHGELISSPSLFTANQQMASIEAGEEIPYQESSSSGATSVTFKKAVLSLKVTPQILPDNKVLLQLQVNQDRPSARLVLGVPTISTRQINTNVLILNGHTVALGGIFESNMESATDSLPFLGKIPIVGWLFQVNNHRKSKRELLIFVTPKIIE